MTAEIVWDSSEDNCYRLPAQLDTGVRCGNHERTTVRHNSAAAVRACFEIHAEWDAESRAEAWAEGGYVRMMENWGAEQAERDDAIARSLGIPV